ncbi:MAG TPA: Nif3-like dinuclear metal center hexameric protein [Bacteroidales bacterium]|nr:Nif3-like dinuclear metal center hexameric protein [Bacteroidales bacterium]
MKTIGDVCAVLESFAPLSLQESYDNAGLILGNKAQVVTGVLIALDATLEVIDEAIRLGFNLIVTHHPFIFKGLKTITGKNHTENCLIKAIRNDVAIYAGHTNVDAVRGGVNERMAEKLGLTNTCILVPSTQHDCDCGLGMVGSLQKSISEADFLQLVKTTFHCERIRFSALRGRSIQKVALCGGSGSEFLENALANGADAFLTGEAKYHEFFTHASEILLVDAGHYETEQFTKDIFFDLLSENFSTFAVRISVVETNPVHYL